MLLARVPAPFLAAQAQPFVVEEEDRDEPGEGREKGSGTAEIGLERLDGLGTRGPRGSSRENLPSHARALMFSGRG